MTPEQRALAAAFMSECWPTVRQYNAADPLPTRKAPKSKAPKRPRTDRNAPREKCPICGVTYRSTYLLAHILRRHPETVQKPSNDGETGVA